MDTTTKLTITLPEKLITVFEHGNNEEDTIKPILKEDSEQVKNAKQIVIDRNNLRIQIRIARSKLKLTEYIHYLLANYLYSGATLLTYLNENIPNISIPPHNSDHMWENEIEYDFHLAQFDKKKQTSVRLPNVLIEDAKQKAVEEELNLNRLITFIVAKNLMHNIRYVEYRQELDDKFRKEMIEKYIGSST